MALQHQTRLRVAAGRLTLVTEPAGALATPTELAPGAMKNSVSGIKRSLSGYDDGPDENNESMPVKRVKVVGLKNLGNTCYNNAVIQALSHTVPLREYFLSREMPAQSGSERAGQDEFLQLQRTRRRTRRTTKLNSKSLSEMTDVNLCNEFTMLLKDMVGIKIENGMSEIGLRRSTRARKQTAISPHAFALSVATALPLFQAQYEQQDAQEFLRCVLERIQEELIAENAENLLAEGGSTESADNTIVKGVFGGVLWNKITCLGCDNYTIKPDPFLDLSLVIPIFQPQLSATDGDSKPSPVITLEQCLDLFSSTEKLEPSGVEMSFRDSSEHTSNSPCLACGTDTGFSKVFRLGELPRVLCIHLKRFRWKQTAARGKKQKVDTLVKFPLIGLDVQRWVERGGDADQHVGENVGATLYDLYAVVVHQGAGVNSGHYMAYVKTEGDWWNINDDKVVPVAPEIVETAKAYLLFYEQRLDPPM